MATLVEPIENLLGPLDVLTEVEFEKSLRFSTNGP